MTAGTSWVNVNGGSAVKPAQPSYLALTISANTALVWPLESTEGSPGVAAVLDITATATGLELQMPPGDTGSMGAQSVVSNVGSDTFTLTDTSGNQIVQIAAGVSWLITLTDNSTTNGSWQAIQLGATTSNAQAGALAGAGLQANGAQLQTQLAPAVLDANTLITAGYRANAITWTGAAGTLTLDTIANLTTGWYCAVQNTGTGALTIGVSSDDTINGAGSIVLQPGNGGLIVADTSTNFVTFGALVGALSIANGGTGASNSAQALTNLGGTTVGVTIFTAASVAAVAALLSVRQQLQADITIYVATTGSDTNNGLTTATAVATLQRAWDILESQYDLNGYTATISLAAGTYSAQLVASGKIVGQQDSWGANASLPSLLLTGAGSGTTTISCSADCIDLVEGATMQVSGLTFASVSGSAIACSGGSYAYIGSDIVFGACGTEHMLAKEGSMIFTSGAYSITGAAANHIYCTYQSRVQLYGATVTISNSPDFTGQFVYCDFCSNIGAGGTTYSGTATGKTYTVQLNGVIYTNGGGANYFPGNAAGTTATGGQYA